MHTYMCVKGTCMHVHMYTYGHGLEHDPPMDTSTYTSMHTPMYTYTRRVCIYTHRHMYPYGSEDDPPHALALGRVGKHIHPRQRLLGCLRRAHKLQPGRVRHLCYCCPYVRHLYYCYPHGRDLC